MYFVNNLRIFKKYMYKSTVYLFAKIKILTNNFLYLFQHTDVDINNNIKNQGKLKYLTESKIYFFLI